MPKTSAVALRTFTRIRDFFSPRTKEKFQREAIAVCLFGIAVFYAMALCSFYPSDPSPIAAGATSRFVMNWCGRFGAGMSALSIFYFGWGAFLFPIALLGAGIWTVMSESPLGKGRFIGCLFFVSATICLLSLNVRPLTFYPASFPAGGVIGRHWTSVMLKYFGNPGTSVLLYTAVLAGLILVFRQQFLSPGLQKVKTGFAKTLANAKNISLLSWPRSEKDEGAGEEPEAYAPPVAFAPAASPAAMMPSVTPREELKLETPQVQYVADPFFDAMHAPRENMAPPAPMRYEHPTLEFFKRSADNPGVKISKQECETVAAQLAKTLKDFGIEGKMLGYLPGPLVTVFEFEPHAGTKSARIIGLVDDLALALRVDSIIIQPVRGKNALGIQVPNARREMVYIGDILGTDAFQRSPSPLTFAMGKSLSGEPLFADLTVMPHLLAAGATGSGKSVAINSLLCSILVKASPKDVRMVLVDPKMLELSVYEGIPHLLMPVITDANKASSALKWAAHEMERRYKIMQSCAVRNIDGFNTYWQNADEKTKQELRTVVDEPELQRLPYILLVIDELADLMLTAPKDVESSIQRLAQKARASGIHLVLATQRPSVDVITGVIKANLPCRISFQVVSKHDSRTILDQIGSEKLLGKGDMLFQSPGSSRLERIHGAFVGDDEVIKLVSEVKKKNQATYDQNIISWIDEEISRSSDSGGLSGQLDENAVSDPKYQEAMQVASTYGAVSASFLQRQMKIGYNRAARIVEYWERQGLVAKADGAKPRRWLGGTQEEQR